MEAKAKLSKKILSTFLAMLMIFSACYVGIDGAYTAYAAAEDSEYTADEVVALINAATANGFNLSSSGNEWNYAADDGKVIAAAEAIFDYALNAYREGKEQTSKGNSTKALYDYFIAAFKSKCTNQAAAEKLIKNVLNPDGTSIYSYESPGTKTTKLSESTTSYGKGADVSTTFPIASYSGYYASGVASGTTTKTVDISLDINKYLMTFAKIEDIPSTVVTNVKYTYSHGLATSAVVTDETSRTEGSGCSAKTYYTTTIKTSAYNYMPSKPDRQQTKDKTIRKTLLTAEKYFNEELLAMTMDEMLAMNVSDIKTLYDTTDLMYKTIDGVFSDTVLNHFGLNATAIHKFMDDVDFAYRVVAAKYNVDNLNALIGTEYNVDSYAEMSALYAKTNTAYNVVFSMDQEIIDYITSDEGGYAGQYASAVALKATAESYNAKLFDIMTEQKLEETVAAMVATYTQYINVLNKEDIENPTDAEVIGLDQKAKAFDSVIASYTGKAYYRTYWKTEYESEWNRFKSILAEVYEVRGLKTSFQTQYDYFLPIIYTTKIDAMSNSDLISLHADLDTKISELRTTYSEVADEWGYTIADKIFTVEYEGSTYLLQTLLDTVKSAGKEAAKTVLIARTEAQLDAVYAYKDTTTVNFDNFASIKSTLTYFDYDLYNYVNGGGEGQNKWLSDSYSDKYGMVQTLLDRYHAFSTTDGKAFFNEDFTFADENGNYGTRYAGSQFDADGNQIGYPNDIARSGAEDNYVVTETKLLDTVGKIDGFITSRDFGAIAGFTDAEDEEVYVDLSTYIEQMLNEMLYNDELINTLVGAIYPMLVDLLNTEVVGMLADMGVNDNPNASACIDIGEMTGGDGSGHLYVYMDDDLFNGQQKQRYLADVLADAGLYVYPRTLADSLLMSNPVAFGVGTPIYTALKAADRDWTKLICADDPETELVDETKVLEFEWGVYDDETFVDTLGCIFDSLLPLLNAVLTGTQFAETLSNAAYAYSTDTKYIVNVGKLAVFGDLLLTIPGLTVYNDVLVPIFEILGVDKIPTLKSGASGDQLAKAIVEPLLGVIDEVLANPLSTVLEILPNLVYFLSMDSVQEILNSLNISLNLKIEAEVDKDNSGTLVDLLGGTLLSLLGDKLTFDVELAIADLIDLYDMLGFEISDFNEVLKLLTGSLGISLPPIKQQEIIFCSDWSQSPTGRVYLEANKGDLVYWFLDYVISALVPDENGNSLLTALLGSEMDPMISGILEKVVSQITGNQNGALAAIIELLNPVEYDLASMNWLESQYEYNGIEGANYVSIVYLKYGNDWTKDKSEGLLANADSLIAAIMEMTGSETAFDLSKTLTDTVNGLFTNANITALVEMLGGLGDSPSAIIADILGEQIGIKLDTWFTAFGYLYPAETWADDAEIIPLGHRNYVNDFGVEGVANEDGTISWFFNKMPLNDGDGYTFVNILTRLLGGASKLVEFLFAGKNLSAFNGLITLKGYETYAISLGLLFEMLGVQNLPTQNDFNADAMGSLNNMLTAVLDWFYALTDSEDIIAQLVEIIPTLFYFIESNGLSTVLRNLLQPVWVIIDTVRPLLDVDINGVLSLVVSEFINYGTLDINVILEYIVHGIYMNDDLDFVWYNVDLFNLTLSEIIKLVDMYLGTNLCNSGLVQVGIKGFCSGLEAVDSPVGTVYKPTIDAADTITILVTALLDCLNYPAADTSKTNGEALFGRIAELTGNDDIAELYPVIADLIAGIDVTYTEPNWGYMLDFGDDINNVPSARATIGYLAYTTDWTEKKADDLYDKLDELIVSLVPDFDGNVAALVNDILNDNVYSDANLSMIVTSIVNLLVDVNTSLFDVIDVVLDTNIATWFTSFCEFDDTTNEYVCVKDWGVDEAADKRAAFVAGLEEAIAPADRLLAWLLLGDSYEFFTGSAKNDNGDYVYNDIINLEGGLGYDRGIVPLFRALGIALPAASEFDTATDAVNAILDGLFDLIDSLSDAESTVAAAIQLIPNVIYFLNADGVKSAVNNLLGPVLGLLDVVGPLLGEEVSLDALLGDLPIDITNITTEAVLNLLTEEFNVQFVAKDEEGNELFDLGAILATLYVGELSAYNYAGNLTGYVLDLGEAEYDVLTLVIGFALELFTINGDLFAGLFGENGEAIVNSIIALLDGYTVSHTDIDWGYMHEGEDIATRTAALAEGFPATSITYLAYATEWTETTSDSVYSVLDEILELVLDSVIDDGDLKKLVDDLIAGNLYKTENLEFIVEAIVNLLADFDASLRDVLDIVLGTDIAAWFAMCEKNADGEYEVIPGKLSGDNKADFIAGLKTVLEPANALLSWLFFGETYTFFNDHTGEVAIELIGGEGYAYGLVPILEALGLEMKKAEAYKGADGKYNVGKAVEDIINAVLTIVDKLGSAESTVEYVFTLLPNLLYFINAGGVNASVANILAPVNGIIKSLSGVVGKESVEELLVELINFDISDLSTDALLEILNDKVGFVVTPEMAQAIKDIYAVGEAKGFTSANGETAYRLAPDMGDVLTVVLSFAIDAFNVNENLFADLLGAEEYRAVYNLIRGAKDQFVYTGIDWGYMYEGGTEELAENNGKLPKYPESSTAATYLLYKNNWNKDTAKYVNDVIDAVIAGAMEGTELGEMLDNAIANGLYQDSILNALLESVVGLIVDYAEIIEGAGVLIGAESISKWFDYCTVDAEGNVTVTHDFGIDEATTNEAKREKFVEAFVDVLEPAYRLLAWLLFDQDFTFFNGTTEEVLITLTGGRGYEEALVPLLEAIGAKMPGLEDKKYENGETALYPADHYVTANGVDMESAVRDVFSALVCWLEQICGNLANQGEYGVIGAMLDLLPNVIYNINAGTLKAVVQNLLVPVEEVLGHLEAFGLEVDFSSLVKINNKPLDLKSLDWYSVFMIVEELVGLYWPENIQEFLATLYVGEAVEFESANGKTAYYMTYNADDEGDYLVSGREDMITLLISFVIDGVLDKRNAPRLSGWLGEDIYTVIYNYLANDIVKVPMQDVDWQLTEYADTGKVVSPITLGAKINSEFYGELYTREMGEYIEKWLPSFVDSMIVLLGVQDAQGVNYEGLEDILNELIGTSLYTKENIQAILDAVKGLLPEAQKALGDELYDVIVNVVEKALGIDLNYWNDYTVADFETGDREAFVNELTRMFVPLYPILRWLLTDEDLIALFYTAEGRDAVVIEGAEGYAYGIIPLLEAFDYDSERILTPDEFSELEDAPSMLKAVLNPVLDVVDKVLADPVNEIFNVLPGVIYFLNSNGLDTVIKNTANAVFTVLENIEPITGELDIYELIGFDAENINVETLISEFIKGLEEDTGFQLTEVALEALKELTVGTVKSYASKNGKTAYTVEYATGADRVDMVTVVLRTVLTFVSIPENVTALEGMLEGELDEEGYKFVCSLLENFSQMAASEGGMDEIMYTVYQIFYAANVAAHSTENWLAEFNGDYSFLNQLFATSDLDFLRQIEISLGDLLNKYTGDIIDDDEVVPNGFIAFFQKIADFFKMIGDFFRNLFK